MALPLRARTAAIAVAGDTPVEVRRNVEAAKMAGKDVRFVTVTSHGASDLYSPYAQLVRSSEGLIARAYGRVHVYRLSGVRVTYPEGIPVSLDALPRVDAATIDTALRSSGHVGVSEARRLRLCEHCDAVFLRANADVPVHNPWPTARDPWQTAPDYIFWKPESDTRKPLTLIDAACYVYYDPACRSGGVGPDQGCPPIYNGCAYYPPPPPPPECVCAIINPSAARRSPQGQSKSTEALAKLRSAIDAHSIPDEKIEANIDQGIPGHARDLVRAAMQRLPPFARQHVAGTGSDGTFFANRMEDYEAHLREGTWQRINGNVWRKPNGEVVSVPDFWGRERAAASKRNALSVSCPPPPSYTTGGYVRGFLCNSTSGVYSAYVDATQVSGPPGTSWCLSLDETGYLLIGAWSNSSMDTAEAGLQWSPTYRDYAMYATDGIGGIQLIPSTYSFPAGFFTMWFTNQASNWAITVAAQSGTKTWTYTKATTVQQGPSWTYKQGTMLAQKYGSMFTDGSYFGVNSGTGYPLFTWSSASGYDSYPVDPTRAIRIGNAYGVNLHT